MFSNFRTLCVLLYDLIINVLQGSMRALFITFSLKTRLKQVIKCCNNLFFFAIKTEAAASLLVDNLMANYEKLFLTLTLLLMFYVTVSVLLSQKKLHWIVYTSKKPIKSSLTFHI